MIVTQGGRFGGYRFYVLRGKPVFLYNFLDFQRTRWEGSDVLSPGKHTLEFDFKYDGLGFGTLAFNSVSGIGRGGTGVLKSTARRWHAKTWSTLFRSSCNGTRTLTLAPIPVPECPTITTFLSGSLASSISSR